MTRVHAAVAIVAASLIYLALSILNRDAAVSLVLVYIAAVVTLLLCTAWSKERRGPQR